MPTIVVAYFERTRDAQGNEVLASLGTETLDGVSEALLPGFNQNYKVFCIKKFCGNANYRWFVVRVDAAALPIAGHAKFEVVLESLFDPSPVEYLHQTIRKTGLTVQRTIRQGTLVEIDYGFVQSIGKEDGQIRSNKRYSDTIQLGEMHKRRLAIVVRVGGTTIQVVPISSSTPNPNDKTQFEISAATLSRLQFYGNSGKSSWAVCGMIETVSIRRVLPPISYYTIRGHRRAGRDTNYHVAISHQESQFLRDALLHSIGVIDYRDNKQELAQARLQLRAGEVVEAELAAARVDLDIMQNEVSDLGLYREVAQTWASAMGADLEDEVRQLRDLYAEVCGTPGSA